MNNSNLQNKPFFFIDFENTSMETHARILKGLQQELDEAKKEKRIPIWDKGLERISNVASADTLN